MYMLIVCYTIQYVQQLYYIKIHLFENNKDKIYWDRIWEYSHIFELDYKELTKRCAIYKEELIQVALHPSRIEKYLEQGISFEELKANGLKSAPQGAMKPQDGLKQYIESCFGQNCTLFYKYTLTTSQNA